MFANIFTSVFCYAQKHCADFTDSLGFVIVFSVYVQYSSLVHYAQEQACFEAKKQRRKLEASMEEVRVR